MFSRSLFAVICIMYFLAGHASAETVRIGTKTAAIREACRFLSPIKISAQYNDELTVVTQQGDWYRVRLRGTEGCIHKSSVQTKKVELTGTTATDKHSASETEVALAGKGFTPEIEKEYQEQNPEVRLDLVNKVEQNRATPLELEAFLMKGGLRLPE